MKQEQKIKDYKEWLLDYLAVDSLEEDINCMCETNSIEAIMEFEKMFNNIVKEEDININNFNIIKEFVDFLLIFLSYECYKKTVDIFYDTNIIAHRELQRLGYVLIREVNTNGEPYRYLTKFEWELKSKSKKIT